MPQVYKGVWQGKTVAVKVCRQQHLTTRAMRQFQSEVAILNSCSHPNVVEFVGACCWKVESRHFNYHGGYASVFELGYILYLIAYKMSSIYIYQLSIALNYWLGCLHVL